MPTRSSHTTNTQYISPQRKKENNILPAAAATKLLRSWGDWYAVFGTRNGSVFATTRSRKDKPPVCFMTPKELSFRTKLGVIIRGYLALLSST
ncbi:hypothetical protein L1049_017534 [Liquidambar formosana]|uniref:Uncharacterized protein n=1 Tax=Liquidambar formosana TaxID=63359 RepID=A0AAP0S4F6_LIQFO